MAKTTKQQKFINAEINAKDMTITEVSKDSTETFDLNEILAEWDGVVGITLTIAASEFMAPCE